MLHHYTLNTGDTRTSPRSEVNDEAIAALSYLTAHGGQLPDPFTAFRVEVHPAHGGAVFTISRGREPIVTCGLSWSEPGAAETWQAMEQLYLGLSDAMPQLFAPAAEPQKPQSLPWLTVLLLPSLLTTARADIAWLADFERCLAWAIIEAQNG